jgi:hypothetical protein
MEMHQDAITAAVGIFSGRPNPMLSFTGTSADELAGLVKATIGKEEVNAAPPPRLGYYHGFAVRMPTQTAKRLGIPEQFTVFQGVLSEAKDRTPRHWRDTGGVERFLLDQAFQQGHGELLKRVGVESPSGR